MKVMILLRVKGEKKYPEKSGLMKVIDYFRILKTFIIFVHELGSKLIWEKNHNNFQTTHFNHTMIFFKLID